MSKEACWDLILNCEAQIYAKTSGACSEFVDAASASPALLVWGMLKATLVEQCYLKNEITNDPALTGTIVRTTLLHGNEKTLKSKLGNLQDNTTKADTHFTTLNGEVTKLKHLVKEVDTLQKSDHKDLETLKKKS